MSTTQLQLMQTVLLGTLLLLFSVEGAPSATAADANTSTAGEQQGEDNNETKTKALNPMCGQAFYNHSIISTGDDTKNAGEGGGQNDASSNTTETVFIENGCCIYDNGHIADTLTGEKRDATEAERQTVREFLDESGRRAGDFEGGLNRHLQNFLACFFDVFKQPPRGGAGAKQQVAPTAGSPVEFGMPDLPCFCAPDHCFSTHQQPSNKTIEGEKAPAASEEGEKGENKGAIEQALEHESKAEGQQQPEQQQKKENVDGGN